MSMTTDIQEITREILITTEEIETDPFLHREEMAIRLIDKKMKDPIGNGIDDHPAMIDLIEIDANEATIEMIEKGDHRAGIETEEIDDNRVKIEIDGDHQAKTEFEDPGLEVQTLLQRSLRIPPQGEDHDRDPEMTDRQTKFTSQLGSPPTLLNLPEVHQDEDPARGLERKDLQTKFNSQLGSPPTLLNLPEVRQAVHHPVAHRVVLQATTSQMMKIVQKWFTV